MRPLALLNVIVIVLCSTVSALPAKQRKLGELARDGSLEKQVSSMKGWMADEFGPGRSLTDIQLVRKYLNVIEIVKKAKSPNTRGKALLDIHSHLTEPGGLEAYLKSLNGKPYPSPGEAVLKDFIRYGPETFYWESGDWSKWEAADKVYILDTYVGPLLGIEVDNIQSKDFVARPPSPISPSTDVAAEFVAAPADLADPKVTKIAPTDGILDSPKTETENGQRRTTERVVEAI